MSTKLFALSFLLACATSRPTIAERQAVNTECWQTNPGTVFYNCANGYKGCFAKDPCGLPPLSSTIPVFANSTSTKPASTTPTVNLSTGPVSTKPASTTAPANNSTIPVSTKPASTTAPANNSTIPVSTKPASTTAPANNSTIPVSTKPASTTAPFNNSTIPVSTKPASATPSPSNPVVNTECWRTNPGTVFYNCANGYKGCFSKDPCSLPPLSSTSPVSTKPVSSTPSATKPASSTPSATKPASSTPSATKPASTGPLSSCSQPSIQSYEMVNPRSFNIYHADAEKRATQDQVPHVDLNKPAGSDITTTNAIVFDNVPAGAKNCRLNWRSVANGGPLRFTVDGEGQAFTRQLLGFPAIGENVSDDSLAKFRDCNAKWSQSLDFQGWTDMPTSHAGPAVKCGSQVAVEVKGSDCGTTENRVQLSIAEKSGFYLTYDL